MRLCITIILLASLLTSCMAPLHPGEYCQSPALKRNKNTLMVMTKAEAASYHATGNASWYGRSFHHRRTSSGERFNMYRLTAAHRTLPLNAQVKVTNTITHQSVIVRINDRGPFTGNRIIDLSYAAAKKIGVTRYGIAPVEISAV